MKTKKKKKQISKFKFLDQNNLDVNFVIMNFFFFLHDNEKLLKFKSEEIQEFQKSEREEI